MEAPLPARVRGDADRPVRRCAHPIVLGATAALLGALAPQALGLLGVVLACAPLLLAALLRRGLDAGCLALPAALCALPPPPALAPPPPPPGPVLCDGRVVTRLIVDDVRGDVRCVLARGHARALCVFARGTRLRPGDVVRA